MSQPAVSLAPAGELALLPQAEEQAHLVQALKARRAWAERTLLEEQSGYVERVLTRILGFHPELDDLVQEVFIRALERVDAIHDPSGLRSWIGAIAVFVAREAIRRRRRRRWLVLFSPDELPEPEAPSASPEIRAAAAAMYELFDRMDPELRIAFALRVVDGMELAELAELLDVSVSTVKRRVQRAEQWFVERAQKDARLAEWAGGAR